METAAQLISKRVVEAGAMDRLASIAGKLQSFRSNHCVVIDQADERFLGVIRLGDVARMTDPGNRILADLVSKIAPMSVGADESAERVAQLFEQHDLGEAVVFSNDGRYQGLITSESVLKWSAMKNRAAEETNQRGAEALDKMQRELVSQSRVRAAFLAAVSHELRTPLNPILLVASDRADREGIPEDLREDFKMIARNVAAEVKVVEELMEVTKILSGNISVNLQPVALHRVLDQAVGEIHPLIQSKGILFQTLWRASDDAVHADEKRLNQIVGNILGNALKFTPREGQITIETSLADDESSVSITFRDTGRGMTADEIGGLFTPFASLGAAGTDSLYRHRGLGLGLAITKNLVDLHHGQIEAHSPGRDQGTTVTVKLKRPPPESASPLGNRFSVA